MSITREPFDQSAVPQQEAGDSLPLDAAEAASHPLAVEVDPEEVAMLSGMDQEAMLLGFYEKLQVRLLGRLDQRGQELSEEIRQATDPQRWIQALEDAGQQARAELLGPTQDALDAADRVAQAGSQWLEQRALLVGRELQAAERARSEELSQQQEAARRQLEEQARRLEAELEALAGQAQEQLQGISSDLSDLLAAHAEEAQRLQDQLGEQLGGLLASRAEGLTQRLQQSWQTLEQRLFAQQSSLEAQVARRLAERLGLLESSGEREGLSLREAAAEVRARLQQSSQRSGGSESGGLPDAP